MRKLTFDLLLEDYFFNKLLRPATIWSYSKVTQTFTRFLEDGVSPEDITHKDVLLWRELVLHKRGLSSRTWNNKVTHLRALFNYGMKKGLLPQKENPFYEAVVRPDQKLKKVLTENQIEQVYIVMARFAIMEHQGNAPHSRRCALLPTRFWLVVLDVLRYTGMRQNQLLQLRLGDISFDDDVITLRAESAKNHKENRVPIISVLKPGLQQMCSEFRLRGMKPHDQFFNVGFLLGQVSAGGEDMSVQTLRAFFRRLSKECGFNVSPHRFRHTIATEMMKQPDSNLQTVKTLLGHSSINTTLEYVDGNVDTVREALEAKFVMKKKNSSPGSGTPPALRLIE
ncbi:tyrosine-type recombinase/integrase [Salmonella enterica subsp. enterica serovar Muenchen]|uniref:tyrosine-type recombinase/integrase n=2 Tax=Salmonella enterica TaxID=28901 RepID=UPI0008FCC625|nr:site-specific integrase [Salmonella enterica]EAA7830301.1 site-specific integrase [Salmonella enterica subsp. enterica serovar Give]EAA8931550.1 site-specific integrase [Salmonella enterica subsp. enterica serovar Gaminara]EAA9479243.1 site-specific integrase [Salmonella enterica subsp. enterica]EAU5115653.1 site-specific integrase [Salmonella enterica subsp. enterica serovar Montevideo]EBL6308138.1 tyrosine-type recombinase/integrase [Salmonella enterica subsp. enterica serovar Rubislaw]E